LGLHEYLRPDLGSKFSKANNTVREALVEKWANENKGLWVAGEDYGINDNGYKFDAEPRVNTGGFGYCYF